MPYLRDTYFMLRSKREADRDEQGRPWYKEASGTSGATPKLYTSEAMAKAAVSGDMKHWEVIEVELREYEYPYENWDPR